MLEKLRLPSPAMVVALIALFVALGGTAVAASPIVKRALLADNALKLNGKPLTAVVQHASAEGAKLPGPASTAAGLVTTVTVPWAANPGQGTDFTVACEAGQKAVGGGFEDPNGWAHPWDSRPTSDGSGWRVYLGVGGDATGPQSGTLYAVCLK